MPRRVLCVALVAFALAQPTSSQSAGGVTVTFLANEGVMLAGGGRKVLIDALFERYSTGCALPADSTRAALAAARAPFDSVDLLLCTHQHGDHFHPAPTAAHLRANPRTTLVTSAQVIDSMKRGVPGLPVPPRQLMARTTTPGTRRRETINGVTVEMLGIAHPGQRNRQVEHLVYVVEIGGRRVLHAGGGICTVVGKPALVAGESETDASSPCRSRDRVGLRRVMRGEPPIGSKTQSVSIRDERRHNAQAA